MILDFKGRFDQLIYNITVTVDRSTTTKRQVPHFRHTLPTWDHCCHSHHALTGRLLHLTKPLRSRSRLVHLLRKKWCRPRKTERSTPLKIASLATLTFWPALRSEFSSPATSLHVLWEDCCKQLIVLPHWSIDALICTMKRISAIWSCTNTISRQDRFGL